MSRVALCNARGGEAGPKREMVCLPARRTRCSSRASAESSRVLPEYREPGALAEGEEGDAGGVVAKKRLRGKCSPGGECSMVSKEASLCALLE